MDTELDAIVQKYGKKFEKYPGVIFLRMYFVKDYVSGPALRLTQYCKDHNVDLELVSTKVAIHISKDNFGGDSELNKDKKLLEDVLKKLPAPQL